MLLPGLFLFSEPSIHVPPVLFVFSNARLMPSFIIDQFVTVGIGTRLGLALIAQPSSVYTPPSLLHRLESLEARDLRCHHLALQIRKGKKKKNRRYMTGN